QIWRICSGIWTKSAKQQPFIVVSDFALLYLIRQCAAQFLLPSYSKLLFLFIDKGLWQKIVSTVFSTLSGNRRWRCLANEWRRIREKGEKAASDRGALLSMK
ncbi:MAG: hypothetical protein KHW76_09255, partial [Oscillibacter sp.]|nr:hypothetical protein [Oscillibacter sp.]